ncbi:hypothetical protein [Quadrisphaera setariae]|uniref:Broad-specificity NMP kinase n=1 Tax=Quadrisphaera setariae TaxID=2593304 RepID=A0A5C8Z6J0_9ACTN|nr:hypothetical protein [Quadrisphaera setariae]TXR52550.1 hypothetical protein FMM08_19070 [Quadrisphaera setariae]
MTDETPAVWWLTGPPCAGGSVTAWELFSSALAGRPRAFVDVDQLGMCYPAPEDDDARASLKARATAVVARHHLDAGAGLVVVSGVLDDGADALVREALGEVPVLFCRLRAEEGALRSRLEQRYGGDDLGRALADARRWDASDLPAVDTTAVPVEEVARRVVDLLDGQPPQLADGPAAPVEQDDDGGADARGGGRALLLCGAPGVGTSTAGFGLAVRSWQRGETCAYLDGRQLSFTAAPDTVSLDARGTADLVGRLWRTYRAAGAEALVVRADVSTADDVEAFRDALAGAPLRVARLRAGEEALRERVAARARGEGANLAGDALRGLDEAAQRRAVAAALERQAQLEQAGAGDVVVDTDGLDPGDVVAQLEALDARRPRGA